MPSSSTQTQHASAKQLTRIEHLKLGSVFITSFVLAVVSLVTGYFSAPEKRPPTKKRQFYYTLMREVPARLSPSQLHASFPTTDEQYTLLCKNHSIVTSSEILEDGTTVAHWIGQSSAENIIIYFHGGGYVLPAMDSHLNLMFQMQSMLSKAGKDVAVLFLSYDLAPVAKYPRQLQQAAFLLDHTINTLGKAPENIIVYGDSGGGNLATALISHILHPHPSTSIPIKPIILANPLRGMILQSPWLSFSGTSKSFRENEPKDFFSPRASFRWSKAFLGDSPPHASSADNYNQALIAPPEWWEDIPVKDVLITAGKDEIISDDIVGFADRLCSVKKEVEFLLAEREAHGAPTLDLGIPFKDTGQQTKKVREWLIEKF
ncbi:alpha/beta-hydrolase [Stipitochalara longipes BDJ]|nr:alpha/beta-hydrolase [Stipitochalara longipes BDJ]